MRPSLLKHSSLCRTIGCRERIDSRSASSVRFAGLTVVGKVVDRQSSGAVVRVSHTLAFYCPEVMRSPVLTAMVTAPTTMGHRARTGALRTLGFA